MMEYVNTIMKVDKRSYTARSLPNDNGLQIHAFKSWHPENMVAIVVLKELKYTYKGIMIKCTHDDFKAGLLQRLTLDDIKVGGWPT